MIIDVNGVLDFMHDYEIENGTFFISEHSKVVRVYNTYMKYKMKGCIINGN